MRAPKRPSSRAPESHCNLTGPRGTRRRGETKQKDGSEETGNPTTGREKDPNNLSPPPQKVGGATDLMYAEAAARLGQNERG
jgi:hypothetical protein